MLGTVCQLLWPSETVHCCTLSVCLHGSAFEICILVFVFESITDTHTFVSLCLCVGVRVTKAAWSQQPG